MVEVEYSWSKLLSILCPSLTNKSQKCNIRLLDTIYLEEDDLDVRWSFTSKSGFISKKKKETITQENIVDRFKRFSLANPQNIEKIVGVLISHDGRRSFLKEIELIDFTSSGRFGLSNDSHSCLQVYLRPYGGNEARLGIQAQFNTNGSISISQFQISAKGARQTFHSSDFNDFSSISTQLLESTKEIISFLKSSKGLVTQEMRIEFILDDNEHIWLSSIPTARLRPCNPEEVEQSLSIITSTAPNSLPHLGSSVEPIAGGNSRPASRLGSSESSRTVSSAASSSSRRGLRGTGGGLLTKEGAVFKCSRGPDDLPGLRAWILSALSPGGSSSWSVGMQEYIAPPASPNAAVEQIRTSRAGSRQVTKHHLVNLMSKASALLLGETPCITADDFESAWQSVASTISVPSSDSEDAEVIVCGNTFAICRKLESLLESGFRKSGILTEPLLSRGTEADHFSYHSLEQEQQKEPNQGRPHSDTAVLRMALNNAVGENGDGMIAQQVNEDGYSDYNGDDTFNDLDAAFPVAEFDVIERDNELTAVGNARLGDKAEKGGKKQPKEANRLKKIKSTYSVSQGVQSTDGANEAGKKARERGGNGTNAFKRSSMEEPPSIDMIAKFAAEKEK